MLKVKSIILWAVLTVICLPSSVKGISTVSYRQFKHFDRQRFCAHISSQPWVVFVGVDDPNNEMWLKWKSLFSEVCDRHPPLHTKYIQIHGLILRLRNWCSNEIVSKLRLHRPINPVDWSNFNELNAKRSYFYQTFRVCDGNSQNTRQIINEVTPGKSNNWKQQ